MMTSADPAETEPKDMTIDEIARFAAVPSSTVRMYQNKGLLPPPIKRGRVGFYTKDHRERLRVIAHMQDRGFSLAAIKDLLDSWHSGRSLGQAMGVTDVAPSMHRQVTRLTPVELMQRFDGVPVTQAEIQRAAALGMIEIDGTDIVITNDAFADMGPSIARMGLSISEILDEYEALAVAVDGIADRFRNVFERHIWSDLVGKPLTGQAVAEVTANVAELTQLATRVVTVALHERFAQFTTEYMEQAQAEMLDD